MRIPVTLHLCQDLLYLFILIIFWYLIVLNCISLRTNNVEHPIMYLLAILISSFENYIFRSSCALLTIYFFRAVLSLQQNWEAAAEIPHITSAPIYICVCVCVCVYIHTWPSTLSKSHTWVVHLLKIMNLHLHTIITWSHSLN